MALQTDGKVVMGGDFSTITNPTAQIRHHVARFNADDSLDTFDPDANDYVYTFALREDGKIVVGGQFTAIGNPTQEARNHIARLMPDGGVDSFNPNIDGTVYAMLMQPDGKLVVGGGIRHKLVRSRATP